MRKRPPTPSVEAQFRDIPLNSPVELRLADGSKLRGWVSDVSDAGFVLTQEQKGQLSKRQIQFQHVQAVKPVKSVKPSHATRNILIGVGIVIVAGILAAAAAIGGLVSVGH